MPAEPRIVKNAEQSPGKCLVSGDNDGPFLDTGRNLKFYGRVYLALRHIEPYLEKAGYLHGTKVSALRGQLREAGEELEELRDTVAELKGLRDAVEAFVRKPEVIEKQVPVYETRQITHADVEKYINERPYILEKYRPAEPGSIDEWNRLYREDPASPTIGPSEDAAPAGPEAPPTSAPGGEPAADDEPLSVGEEDQEREIEVDGVTIDLDEVLAQNVQTIVDYAEGHPALCLALARREERTTPKGEPRKTVLALRNEVTA